MNFVIISLPRCGTSMLVNAMNSLDNFNVYGELFASTGKDREIKFKHPQKIQEKMVRRRISEGFVRHKAHNKTYKTYLDHIYSQGKNVGFKLLYPHVKKYPKLIDEINNRDIYKILMYRNNELKRIISGATNKKKLPIKIIPKNIVNGIYQNRKMDKQLRNWFENGKYIRISYEELTQDKNVAEIDMSKIWDFFGIDMLKKIKSPLKKYTSTKIRDNIENYDDLVNYIEKNNKELVRYLD